jgi:hypothetical protein
VEQAGTATYGTCLQIQKMTQNAAFSRVDFGTVSDDNSNDDVGLFNEMRMYISFERGKHDVACSLLGVNLKKK